MERITWFYLAVASCLTMAVALTNSNLTTDESALLALKARTTSDPHNMIFTNWSTTAPVCSWVGVTCGARHFRVSVLNLSYMGLTSTIPPELGNLSFLSELLLRNNSFHGPLPQELARLRRLKSISLRFNSFKGIIPSWFGSLSKLQAFDLYRNQFSGSIPPAIFNLSALELINLSYNQLSGSIPSEIGNLTLLKDIYLDGNNFKELPNEIGTLEHLEELYVQFNLLNGHIPTSVFNMSSLTILTFFRNNLSGSLPGNLCQHLPNIQVLSLSYNQFEGPLPSKWLQCEQLVSLELGMNSFSGSIPTSIANLTQLKMITLAYNRLTGTLPYEIGYLPNLESLILGSNNVNGLIPSSIFNISTIRQLDLDVNELSGSLPTKMGFELPNLLELYIGGNKLSGVIPKSISNASQLTIIDLGGGFFFGSVPSTLCALSHLEVLSLFQNNLTIDASLPEADILTCLPDLKKLGEFQISDNPLNARLPNSFWNFSTSLQIVKLANCNLKGYIPSDISYSSSLTILELGGNEQSGPTPTSMGRLQNLQILDLSDNKFQGDIPDQICQLNHLGELHLYGNHLSGSIPSCLGNLTSTLRSLLLGYNMLNFTIPSTLWELKDILKLDLSSNLLTGSISESVGNLKVATLIELSNNQLFGSIPNSIGSLQNLVYFSLANNNLEGAIPSSVGKSISLEFLDLSKNNLAGVIPKSLESLSHLKHLNLSFNLLQGEIPAEGPFKNLSAESFVSNHRLCGESQFNVPPCSRKTSRSILKYVIPVILSAMLVMIIMISRVRLCCKKRVEPPTEISSLAQLGWRRVSYNELVSATNGFNMINVIGSGGFGSVYRGRLFDGIDVAIKVFHSETEKAFRSFEVECELLSNLRHRNLVEVISCCSQIDFKALVLDYMPNGSLEKLLYSQTCSLNMLQRMNIMIDVASALEYLHHGYDVPIVHCDLKPNNILLDDDMVAHVADFGIAKLLDGGDSMTQTMTLGTIGYMAPEYGREGIVNIKGDLYSFGIVVMETFTRRKPTDEMFTEEMSLKQWVANSLFADTIVEIVDNTLLETKKDHDVVRKECLSSLMRLALSCSAE